MLKANPLFPPSSSTGPPAPDGAPAPSLGPTTARRKTAWGIQPAATPISAGSSHHWTVEQKDDELGSKLGCLSYPKYNLATEKLPIVVVWAPSHVRLFATSWTVAHQAPLSMAFPRQEYWSGLSRPPPGDLPDSRIKPTSPKSPALQADSLPLSHRGSSCKAIIFQLKINF